jgi:hypothetical protein
VPDNDPDGARRTMRRFYALAARTGGGVVRRRRGRPARGAAAERAAACRISDGWVADGCDPDSPALPAERAALVRSYTALLAAVHR